MEQEVPASGDRVADRPELAATLGLSGRELSADLPWQVVSTGTPHLLVQARNRAAVAVPLRTLAASRTNCGRSVARAAT
jgi:predicted PhzF superfamily epimerase YddE/YHI9